MVASEMTDQSPAFNWLHFSDIHVGSSPLEPLWPRFGTLLLDELARVVDRVGPIDVIIFSGDLTQSGTIDEFERFEQIFTEIRDKLGEFQTPPKLITVPGNHDLARPATLSPMALAIKQFWNNRELQDSLWKQAGEEYRSFIAGVFKNYTNWQSRAIENGLHVEPAVMGLLPGDSSYRLETASGRLGIVALNSTWLQLSAVDYEGYLHVDAHQLHATTKDRPDDWVRQNDANLLVTHHPSTWLHDSSPATWANDINPRGRFDLHLFGHMHEPNITSTSHGGGLPRRDVQAASLFGLETYGGGTAQRIQGYSANQIAFNDTERAFTNWPRRLLETGSGMKLAPDSTQDLDEDTNSFSIKYIVERGISEANTPLNPQFISDGPVELTSPSLFNLEVIRHYIIEGTAHQNVRRIVQETCVAALLKERIVLLASDWGMGKDGFISSIRNHLSVPNNNIYSIDFSGYKTSDTFFDDLHTRYGASFQRICEAVADVGPSILIFDDVEMASRAAGEIGIDSKIEELAETVTDFAADAFILIRCRRLPRSTKFQTVELTALDEADLAVYVGESEIGGKRFAKPNATSILYRHTDGIPGRIDAALRDLEIISLNDLISSDPDYADTGGTVVPAPPGLVSTLRELNESDDRADQRARQLLLALAAFPQGEQLPRLKRFLGVHPIGPRHARVLLERLLIDTVTLPTLDTVEDDSTRKALVVPRLVREFVRDTIDDEEVHSIDRKALELYFGDDWSSGNIKNSPTCKRVQTALCDGYEIQNAGAVILRTTRRAIERDDEREVRAAIKLTQAFLLVLMGGNHFRAAASLCEDIVVLIEGIDDYKEDSTILRYEYARSLRMIGRGAEARVILEKLEHEYLTKLQRQTAELNLALYLDQQGENRVAAEAAKRTISIDKNTSHALQAKGVIAGQIEDDEERIHELQKLLALARRKKSHVAANNIALNLAFEPKNQGANSDEILKSIVLTARSEGDFYNAVRAIINLAEQLSSEERLTAEEFSLLIEAYHFLFNERLYKLFNRCHDVLWRTFEQNDDRGNLLRLYRKSSFIWRLNGNEDREKEYLAKLAKSLKDIIAEGLTQKNRDGAYFLMRATVVLGELPGASKDSELQ